MLDDTTTTDTPINLEDRQGLQRQSTLAGLEQRWWALMEQGAAPLRRHVTADTIGRDVLPHAFIAERIAPGHARLRVAGHRLSDLIGSEARGMPLLCLFDPACRDEISNLLEKAFATPAIISVDLESPRAAGRPALKGRLLLLPLQGDTGKVDRVLGALIVDGQMGHRPRRMQVVANGMRIDRLDNVTVSRPGPLRAITGGAQHAIPLRRNAEPRPALRLVVDNG